MYNQNIARYKYIMDEVLRLTDDGFIVVDDKGVVTDINDKYCEFLGHSKDEIVGYPITKVIKNSKMIDIVTKGYSEELALHRYAPGDTKEKDNNLVLVSRSCVFDEENRVVAGVAQVKFRLQTLESAKRLVSEYEELESYRAEYQSTRESQYGFQNIIGSSSNFLDTKRAALKAAKSNFSVLLTGETGTGKEVFARAIHQSSQRSDKPMVSINCAAIPSDLLESELFGYVEGAFTGAKKGGKKGKFQLANGGTLFLDEIGDMPLHMQAKILRVLQENEVEPVGGLTSEPVDVRIISATRRNLTEMIEQGTFREDLYYRLNVINIEMLPLRDRSMDILELANHFLSSLNQEYNQTVVFSSGVKQNFLHYQWPGNIRELENIIKGAYAACDGFMIDMIDLPPRLTNFVQGNSASANQSLSLSELMDNYEREVIKSTLNHFDGNCQQAANSLGIHRSALYKKMAKLNIHRKLSVTCE